MDKRKITKQSVQPAFVKRKNWMNRTRKGQTSSGVKHILFVCALLSWTAVVVLYINTGTDQLPSTQLSETQQEQRKEQQQPVDKDGEALVGVRSSTKIDTSSVGDNDDRTATVMGMATGYSTTVYSKFVGSLRRTGYRGHIILGVAPDISRDAKQYLESRNVTMKTLSYMDCTYEPVLDPKVNKKNHHTKEMLTCAHPYPDIKIRWSRFPLQRDWLLECDTCTGPVLTIDVRDAVFQRNPFGEGSPKVEGLQVFEESPQRLTDHWLVRWPLKECKNIEYNETMLCSGSTIGTRTAMIDYLTAMYNEMKQWIVDPKCRFSINGDDQTIHNYLYYSGQLKTAKAIPNRYGIVHTIGVDCAKVMDSHKDTIEAQGRKRSDANNVPFPGSHGNDWLGDVSWVKAKEQKRDFTINYNVTNADGLVINADDTVSRVVHQYDRCGLQMRAWLEKQYFYQDSTQERNRNGNVI